MIRLYRFGEPFETDAVANKIPAQPGGVPPYFSVEENGRVFALHLDDGAAVYGLGETVRGINKRGWIYTSLCADEANHTEDKHSLYAAHNFLLIGGARPFGVFFDYPGKLTFDIGYSLRDELRVTAGEANLDLYIVEGDGFADIARQFRRLTGRSYIAPKWAFGYGQSRWSYYTADEVREVVRRHRENHIPLDSVYLDIDYMDHYKDFTVDEKAFPDFPAFVQEMKEENIHLVPIIDAGVKVEEGYPVYEEGVKNGYFCTDGNGEPFTGAVWPGLTHFPDFLNPEARKWFGDQYGFFLKQGVEGFWNDMNEPAIFYSREGLAAAFQELEQLKGKNLGQQEVQHLREQFGNLPSNPNDYASFYHSCGGRKVRHDRVHNLYGYNMTRAAGEAFARLSPEKRVLMFARSSAIGAHRYGGVWTGDNCSWWSHLLLEIQMMPALSLCGFLYTGADIGGFGGDTTPDLLLRWLAFGIFTPLMRNHSAMDTREQEAYRFPQELAAMRGVIGVRYALLPYLYSEYMKAALNDGLYFKPLAFDYPDDPRAVQTEDQLLLGNELMLAPVYTQNATGRAVYLPEPMLLVRMRSAREIRTEQMDAGLHDVPVAPEEVVFFLRPNCVIPLSSGGESVPEVDFETLFLLANVQTEAVYSYYNDDGYETDYGCEAHTAAISVNARGEVGCQSANKLRLTLID